MRALGPSRERSDSVSLTPACTPRRARLQRAARCFRTESRTGRPLRSCTWYRVSPLKVNITQPSHATHSSKRPRSSASSQAASGTGTAASSSVAGSPASVAGCSRGPQWGLRSQSRNEQPFSQSPETSGTNDTASQPASSPHARHSASLYERPPHALQYASVTSEAVQAQVSKHSPKMAISRTIRAPVAARVARTASPCEMSVGEPGWREQPAGVDVDGAMNLPPRPKGKRRALRLLRNFAIGFVALHALALLFAFTQGEAWAIGAIVGAPIAARGADDAAGRRDRSAGDRARRRAHPRMALRPRR